MTLSAATTALVLLDFQPPPLASLGDRGGAVLANAATALAHARHHGATVAHVRVGFRPEDIEQISLQNKTFAGLRGVDRYRDGSEDCRIVDELQPAPGEITVRKTRLGALSTTDLAAQLRSADVNHLVLAGQSTSGVVLSTVREAADLDFGLTILRDASGDPDDDVNTYLMDVLFPRQGDVVTTSEFSTLLG